ncbi:MAG: Zn-dependent alcohol dehydrogenase [Candidatus Promineifilaceae bacterium]
MKAAVCREFGQPMLVEELTLEAPKTGEIKVKVHACAICHSDILAWSGGWGGSLPAVYGHEAAGIVEEIGEGVTAVKVGDPVVVTLVRSCGRCFFCVKGQSHLCEGTFALQSETRLSDANGEPVLQALNTAGFAEYVIVDQSQVAIVPGDMRMDSASLLACGVITGLGAVTNTAQMPYGSSVVVIGCGGVGLSAIQGAALSGGQPIIAVDLVDSKLDAALEFGATHTINPLNEDALARVKELTNGRGADYVFMAAGSGKAIEQGLDLMRIGGTLCLVGMPASGVKMIVEAANFAGYSQSILGSKMGSTSLQIDIPKLVELYQQGRLKLDEMVTKHYKLEEINEAIAAVERGEALRNVIVFD